MPKSNRERTAECRARKRANAPPKKPPKSGVERTREWRARKKALRTAFVHNLTAGGAVGGYVNSGVSSGSENSSTSCVEHLTQFFQPLQDVQLQRLTMNLYLMSEGETLNKLKCYQCKNYLSYFPISICSKSADSCCGRCALPNGMMYIHNLPFEHLCKFIKFPCRYIAYGCTTEVFPRDVPGHENCCNFRPVGCPIGEQKCQWSGLQAAVLDHCKTEHCNIFLIDGVFSLDLSKFGDTCINILEHEHVLFILEREFQPEKRLLRCSVCTSEFESKLQQFACELRVECGGKCLLLRRFACGSFEQKKQFEFALDSCEDTVLCQITINERFETDISEQEKANSDVNFTHNLSFNERNVMSTKSVPKTGAQRTREWRARNATLKNPPKSGAQRSREWRARKKYSKTDGVHFLNPAAARSITLLDNPLDLDRISGMSNEPEKYECPLSKKPKVEVLSDEDVDPLSVPSLQDVKIEPSDHVKSEVAIKNEPLEHEELEIKDEIIEEKVEQSTTSASTRSKKKHTNYARTEPKTSKTTGNSANAEALKAHIFQFKITLLRGRSPQIWRRIQVPGNYTFREFHIAIQKAMGWKSVDFDYHLHAFDVENPRTRVTDAIVTAEDVNVTFRAAEGEVKNEDTTPIVDYFTKLGQLATYEYDFGMGWEHEIMYEQILRPNPGDVYPKCLAGQKACPPEDGVVDSDEEYDSDQFDPKQCFP